MIDRRKKNFEKLWKSFLSYERLPKLDRWLKKEFQHNPQFGKRDRAWYSDQMFQSCRFAWSAWAMAKSKKPILDFLRETEAEYFASLIEKRIAENKSRQNLEEKLVWAGLNPELSPAFRARAEISSWSEKDQDTFLQKLAERAPLWIRCNRKSSRQELLESGIEAEGENPSFRVKSSQSLYDNALYKEGAFEIQDWASQQIGFHVPAKNGDKIWDACAGGGGKTLQLAAQLEGRGAVYASDIRAYKLQELERRLKRTPFQNVRTFVWQGDEVQKRDFPELKGAGFDSVLVDAPCSSSGTMRRNPDLRLTLSAQIPADLLALQLQLLKNASRQVKKGGHLVYATCSFFVEENEGIVKKFLQDETKFTLVGQGLHGNPAMDSDTTFSALFAI